MVRDQPSNGPNEVCDVPVPARVREESEGIVGAEWAWQGLVFATVEELTLL